MNPSRRWLRGADYSYGIYLYGFSVQQTVVYMLPAARLWYVNALVSLPLVVLVAAFSWHVVEKPANRLRPWLTRVEAWFVARQTETLPAPVRLTKKRGWATLIWRP
jgi:peptidoglycan/LPS O-acetylase OafA/YrhL